MSTATDGVRGRWGVPLTGVVVGAAMCVASGLNGRWGLGLAMLAIMVAYGALLLVFGGREPVAMLAREDGDERQRAIQARASHISFNLVAVFVVGGFVVDLARGGDGMPWAVIAAVGGAAYIATVAVLSRRG
ncbi:hypothetical protein [Actinomadura montaniterrae]|uniref:DUF2178 domain-containing protein n=1 Tax=Actinomadura montaniterrae TaxID=1803903 RepID=A0A6L3W174_9ACTN|nr:hypothetical protein [Actinomadura montaniterrae]KAB2380724.1 hypothetical protein F9B16_17055 [Actinomadura montaniterrae]